MSQTSQEGDVLELLLEYREVSAHQVRACRMYAKQLMLPSTVFTFLGKFLPIVATLLLTFDLSGGASVDSQRNTPDAKPITLVAMCISAAITCINFSIGYFQWGPRVAKLLQQSNDYTDVRNDIIFIIHRRDYTEATALCICERITSIQRKVEPIPEAVIDHTEVEDPTHTRGSGRMAAFENGVVHEAISKSPSISSARLRKQYLSEHENSQPPSPAALRRIVVTTETKEESRGTLRRKRKLSDIIKRATEQRAQEISDMSPKHRAAQVSISSEYAIDAFSARYIPNSKSSSGTRSSR
jgi:hypothetical protein